MSYLRNRLIQAAITLWATITIAFFLMAMRADISQPFLYSAYVDYLHTVFVEFELGRTGGIPVTDIVARRAPWTVFVSTVALVISTVLGIVLGSFMAYLEGSEFDIWMTVIMTLNSATPYYIAAIFLLWAFSWQLGWFPDGGRANFEATAGINWPWIASVFNHAFLPALSFVIVGFGSGALAIRANAIRLIGSDYLRNARLRGLTPWRIAITYLARNAILPRWTAIITGLGTLLGGSAVVEAIFQYPGMGLLMVEAARTPTNFPILMGVFVLTSVIFVAGTIIVDFTYPLIDPRADVKKSRE